MTRDCEKLSILLMFRGSRTNIRNIYWNNCGFSLKLDVSAGYLWSKKTSTTCHLKMSLERSHVVKKRSF